MCLLLFAWEADPRYRLVVAANRDEWYAREAEPARPWGDRRGIVAGVDRRALGTWLGVSAAGRFAALTNYRDPRELRPLSPDEPSRGELVRGFLESEDGALEHAAALLAGGGRYRGYNLIGGDVRALSYSSNRGGGVQRIEPGVHGLSNHLLDTPWPKVRRGKAALAALLEGGRLDVEALLAMMSDETVAPDAELPDTGVGLETERLLSPMFIRMPTYGTRCTTVVLVERTGLVTFVERTHAPQPLPDVRLQFRIVPGQGEVV